MLGCSIPIHTCIDNCICSFARIRLRLECNKKINELRIKYGENYEQPTAIPMLTDAYNLPAKKIIHVEDRLIPPLEKDLADCYVNMLNICKENNLKSVAFCCISTGVFRR